MISNVYLNASQLLRIEPPTNNATTLIETISILLKLSPSDFYLTQNGKLIKSNLMCNNAKVNVHLRLLGGKGGFGSMLRAIGAQIEKTTNREACRDLSGRRLRDINEEKRLKAYLEKQAECGNDEAEKRAKKIAKLRAQPKHEFKDDEYFNARSSLVEDVSDALEEGLKNANTTIIIGNSSSMADGASTSQCSNNSNANGNGNGNGNVNINSTDASKMIENGIKRKNNTKGKKLKKKMKGAQWLDDGLSSDDSSTDNSSTDDYDGNKNDDKSNAGNSSNQTEKSK